MTDSNTPLNQQAEVFDGNVVFDNVFILNNLDYDFSNNDITTKNLRVTGIATFGTSSTTIDGDGNTITYTNTNYNDADWNWLGGSSQEVDADGNVLSSSSNSESIVKKTIKLVIIAFHLDISRFV